MLNDLEGLTRDAAHPWYYHHFYRRRMFYGSGEDCGSREQTNLTKTQVLSLLYELQETNRDGESKSNHVFLSDLRV